MLLALFHHDPDAASPHARAGALFVWTFLTTILGLIKGFVEAFSKK